MSKHVRTAKTLGLFGSLIGCFLALIQIVFYLAIAAGIIYFIAYAITHWLRW